MADAAKRTYDATRRRERAEQERRATRRRVLDAARRLFARDGYTATTMTAIANEAGVAIQSVYKAGTSKAELLHMVVDLEVAGDDEDVMYADRAVFRAIGEEADPRRQVRMLADLIASIQERSAPIQIAYRQAAAVDAAVSEHLRADLERRRETFAAAIDMLPPDRLRQTPAGCADTAWSVGSSEVFVLLRVVRGWDADRYREWLGDTLEAVLLLPS